MINHKLKKKVVRKCYFAMRLRYQEHWQDRLEKQIKKQRPKKKNEKM